MKASRCNTGQELESGRNVDRCGRRGRSQGAGGFKAYMTLITTTTNSNPAGVSGLCAGEGQEEDERLVTETIDEHCDHTDVVSIHMVLFSFINSHTT